MILFGRLRFIFLLISVLALMLLFAPLVYIVHGAFFEVSFADPEVSRFTLDYFSKALSHPQLLPGLQMSLTIALISAVSSTLLALVAALGLQGANLSYQLWFRKLFYLPLMVPEIVIGISLLLWFVFLKITLGPISLILAHITFTLSYAIIVVTLGLEGIDKNLFEAATDLGANKFETFRHVTLPLLVPSLASSFLLCFVISFDDFLISFFLAGVGHDTLPMKLYSMVRFGVTPEIKAISTLILFFTFITSLGLIRLMSRPKVKTSKR